MPSNHNLRPGILSATETLGQSIASLAPTAVPAMTVCQVFALSGNGSWLAYLIATICLALVAANINQFARKSASPGALYSYTVGVLPPIWSVIAAWSLVLAYIGTAIALTGGLTSYARIFLIAAGLPAIPNAVLTFVAIGGAGTLAYCDVTVSARLMLILQGVAVTIISVIVGCTLYSHSLRFDHDQIALTGVTASSLRLGLVLAIFGSVGFESATALGGEARNPFRSIPRAVMLTAVCAGLFFTVCAYAEVMAFHGESQPLDQSLAPLSVLAAKAKLPILGTLINLSAIISFFSCALACITASARVLFDMGRKGDLHAGFGNAHVQKRTPHRAVALATVAALIPGVLLASRGVSGFDINGWLGTVATYGFLVTYGSVCVAAPLYLRSRGELTISAVTISCAAMLVMIIAFAGSLYPVPPAPYSWLPYIFALILAIGVISSVRLRFRTARDATPTAISATVGSLN